MVVDNDGIKVTAPTGDEKIVGTALRDGVRVGCDVEFDFAKEGALVDEEGVEKKGTVDGACGFADGVWVRKPDVGSCTVGKIAGGVGRTKIFDGAGAAVDGTGATVVGIGVTVDGTGAVVGGIGATVGGTGDVVGGIGATVGRIGATVGGIGAVVDESGAAVKSLDVFSVVIDGDGAVVMVLLLLNVALITLCTARQNFTSFAMVRADAWSLGLAP